MQPVAFQIRNYKSIRDSGECALSGDGVTALAGQNEAGKSAVLTALRDFDTAAGEVPVTPEFLPDGREADGPPRVAIQFKYKVDDIRKWLDEEHETVPTAVFEWLELHRLLWISRDLETNTFQFEPDLAAQWKDRETSTRASASTGEIEADGDEEDDADSEAEDTKPDTRKVLDTRAFVDLLRQHWPMFLYFNEFDDTLPRDVAFTDLEQELERRNSGSPKPASRVKQPVWDFVSLARIDVGYVAKIAGDDKKLSNYLANRAAHITGDFLSYWTQRADDESTVDLRVRHHRDTDGDLRLAFYVHDTADQYPEQRSKGFLQFLSFYLRLAATHIAGSEQQLFLLIDEPGSYLHAKAQKDVLRLFDERIAKRDLIAYATHSPYLLPPEKLHRVRVVSKDQAKGTRVFDRLTHPDLRGNAFGDALSPVLTRIGLDIRDRLLPIREKNIIVEGISDYLYLAAWADRIDPDFLREFSIFPATGAPTVPSLISLMRGWGLSFVVLLDRDKEGNRTRDRLMRELLVPDERIVQPQDAIAIEDVFDTTEFASILAQAEWVGKTEHGQTPTAIIKRERLDKVLIAQAFASMPREQMLDGRSADRFRRLLGALRAAADGPSGLPQGIPAWTPGGERKTARVARGPTP